MASTAVCMALLVLHHRAACQVPMGNRAEFGAYMLPTQHWQARLAHACSHHRRTVSRGCAGPLPDFVELRVLHGS